MAANSRVRTGVDTGPSRRLPPPPPPPHGSFDDGYLTTDISAVLTQSPTANYPTVRPSSLVPEPHRLPLRLAGRSAGLQYDKRRYKQYELGTPVDCRHNEKVVLVIGATGSGKSTMIDSLVNYMHGVKYEMAYRYTITDSLGENQRQVQSQTALVTCYRLYRSHEAIVPFTLTLIDTPGFGDTRGIQQDEKIVNDLRCLLLSPGLKVLDAICFVVKASENRLTSTQRYIFERMTSLFGHNVSDIIHVLCSHCDSEEEHPAALSMLRQAGLEFKYTHMFNNVSLKSNLASTIGRTYWQINTGVWRRFIMFLQEGFPCSMDMTKDVLLEREELSNNVESLHWKLCQRLSMIDRLKTASERVRDYEKKAIHDVSFEAQAAVMKREIDGQINLNCVSCEQTCRRNLSRWEKHKRNAKTVKGSDKNCIVCLCPNAEHKAEKFAFNLRMETKTFTRRIILAEFEQNVKAGVSLLECLKNKRGETERDVQELLVQIQGSHNTLQSIALRPVVSSVVDYIDLLVTKETHEQVAGYPERITVLQDMKRRYTDMQPTSRFLNDSSV